MKHQMTFYNSTRSLLGFWGFLRADLHFLGYGEAWPLGHLRDKQHHLSSKCVLPESLGRRLESGGGAAQTVRGAWAEKHSVPVLRGSQFKVAGGKGTEGMAVHTLPFPPGPVASGRL